MTATLTDHARTRSTDPETSHEAAASIRDLRGSQREVLDLLLRVGPCTDERLVQAANIESLPQSPSGIRSRRAELVEAGLVEFTGDFERLDSGRRARVWAVS